MIRNRYLTSYEQKHPSISDDTEARFFNSFELASCKYCGSTNIKKNGFTKNGIQRYKCSDCKRSFTVLTNTLFDDHKVPITEWIEFCLVVFSYGSVNFTTTVYWLHKLFIIVESIEENVMLQGHVYIDEMYISVARADKTIVNEKKLRGLSKDQYCIAVAYDKKHLYACVMGMGKPSKERVWKPYKARINSNS